jgi:ribosome modulation factor
MNKVAMDEGGLACQAGRPSSENPYRQGTDERFGWLLGWVGASPRAAPPAILVVPIPGGLELDT